MAVQDRRQATIYEVAQRVGVSIATVSRALRGTDYVAPETRRRVLAAVEELQFRPSRLGQSLAEGRHAANGIVFPDLSGPYYSEVVLGYEEVAAELGNSVLILATHGRPDPARKVLELARRVDGMVVMGRTVADGIVAQVAETGVPTVLLARAAVGALDTITADNDSSARRLVEHLLGLLAGRDRPVRGVPGGTRRRRAHPAEGAGALCLRRGRRAPGRPAGTRGTVPSGGAGLRERRGGARSPGGGRGAGDDRSRRRRDHRVGRRDGRALRRAHHRAPADAEVGRDRGPVAAGPDGRQPNSGASRGSPDPARRAVELRSTWRRDGGLR
jgi:LacI family transcriptional regulator